MNDVYLKDVRQVFYPNEEICGWEFLKIKKIKNGRIRKEQGSIVF